jgi:hypothetical protein
MRKSAIDASATTISASIAGESVGTELAGAPPIGVFVRVVVTTGVWVGVAVCVAVDVGVGVIPPA